MTDIHASCRTVITRVSFSDSDKVGDAVTDEKPPCCCNAEFVARSSGANSSLPGASVDRASFTPLVCEAGCRDPVVNTGVSEDSLNHS